MKILFISPYPYSLSPSQRFRYEQYFHTFSENGMLYDRQSFLDEDGWNIIYKDGNAFSKSFAIIKGFVKRFFLLFSISRYSYVFIHREASPIGPPVFEWLIAKIFRKKIIYDFDDAIWLEQKGYTTSLKKLFKNPAKVNRIISWSYKVSVGNEYLKNHALKYNSNVEIIPTTIDLNHHHGQVNHNTGKLSIGWTGSHSTLMYLEPLIPVIKRLEEKWDFDFLLICNQDPGWDLKSLKFISWSKENEVKYLLDMNIGVMPLPDDEWTRGKCGFKALQYMAVGIPAVVSPVAVNKEIVQNGINGFWASTDEEWYQALDSLLEKSSLRMELGQKAMQTVKEKYSVEANKNKYLRLFS